MRKNVPKGKTIDLAIFHNQSRASLGKTNEQNDEEIVEKNDQSSKGVVENCRQKKQKQKGNQKSMKKKFMDTRFLDYSEMQRLSFVFQLSLLCRSKNSVLLNKIAPHHSYVFQSLRNKLVLKLDPSVKRFFCKVCGELFLPCPFVSRFHLKGRKQGNTAFLLKCNHCKTIKKFPMAPPKQRKGQYSYTVNKNPC
eukprot:GCRY01001261.1.p1 GENE.GCRY01001261.1~~GCRY01001261.1.p1  ORF type:complete len:194 (+),score=15.76 GCRY01001261.1:136-717(+)